VEASTNNGATWSDLFAEAGGANTPEASFTRHTLSLASCAGQLTLLRFNFAFSGGSYYAQSDNAAGWNIEDIVLTNARQQVITLLDTTNFSFTPSQPGTWLLQAQPVIFTQFPLAFGPPKIITAASVVLSPPALANGQVILNFAVAGVQAPLFQLLQTSQLGAAWTTNTTAALTTNIPGSSYRFTTTVGAAERFYRIVGHD
jgi:hypothetical protein